MNNMGVDYECIILFNGRYRVDSYCVIICHFQVTRWYFLIHIVRKKVKFSLRNIFPDLSQRSLSMKNAKSYFFILQKI